MIKPLRIVFWMVTLIAGFPVWVQAEDGYELWLRYRPEPEAARREEYARFSAEVLAPDRPVARSAQRELRRAFGAIAPSTGGPMAGRILLGTRSDSPLIAAAIEEARLARLGPEGFVLKSGVAEGRPWLVIASTGDSGLLYGAFTLLRRVQRGLPLVGLDLEDAPTVAVRVANHWDNPYRAPRFRNESIERGYAGESLFDWKALPGTVDPRLHDWARLLAAMGMNGVMINNVNTAKRGLEGWRLLTPEYLPKLAALASVLRPYGVRLSLSVNFFSPILVGGLTTADPFAPEVKEWWKAKTAEIYAAIPDFGGYLIKADSEGEPGPMKYGRTHADGANLIASVLAPYGGTVHWRAFVYDRAKGDRVVQAYQNFAPFDGQFASTVFIQIKNGPLDFQVREPVSSLLGAMPRTNQLLELQITQEYTGQDKHVCFLAPLWREVLDFDTHARGPGATVARLMENAVHPGTRNGIVGVMNTGSSRNWTGHLLAQANTFALARLAWNPTATTAESIAQEWAELTFGRNPLVVRTVASILLESRGAYENYTSPLGLNHMTRRVDHFVPDPIYRIDHHGATKDGVGFDRTARTGSGYAAQFAEPWRSRYENVDTCPEELLLFFHHVPWERKLRNGRPLIQELYDRYYAGAAAAHSFVTRWESLRGLIDEERFEHVLERLKLQAHLADGWVGTLVPHWMEFSDTDDEKARPVPQPHTRRYVAP